MTSCYYNPCNSGRVIRCVHTRETRKIAALKIAREKERNRDYNKQISSRAWLRFTFYRYREILLALSVFTLFPFRKAQTNFSTDLKNLTFTLNAFVLQRILNPTQLLKLIWFVKICILQIFVCWHLTINKFPTVNALATQSSGHYSKSRPLGDHRDYYDQMRI